jgi:hypothetical protein
VQRAFRHSWIETAARRTHQVCWCRHARSWRCCLTNGLTDCAWRNAKTGVTRQQAKLALLNRAAAGAGAMALASFRQRRPAVFGWYGAPHERWLFRHGLLELDKDHDRE